MKQSKQDSQPAPEAMLPLTPASFHILMALFDDEKHGYGIMLEVEQRTAGDIRLGAGTLYGSLKRMLASGLVHETGEKRDPRLDDERRRYYRLTPFGQAVLRAEAARLESLVRQARSKSLLDPEAAR